MLPLLGPAAAAVVSVLSLLAPVPRGGPAPVPSVASVEVSSTSARATVAAAVAVAVAPRWHAPLDGPLDVLRPFRPPAQVWLPGHRGVDLAATPGASVLAAGAGTVTWASVLVGRGVVVVLHPDGRRTTYEPVDASVTVGEHVAAGQVIGRIGTGDTHCGGLPSCLHWGLRRGRDYLDPWHLLHPGHPVLLPP